jgi:FKBP-type peptidyl-prolyl cis-trans isomerase FkpA/FKBP-type peptidyl-prolyl cis-trans isomerase FklB
MKLSKIIAIASAAVLMAACGGKAVEGSKEVRDLLPTQSAVDSVSYLIGVNFGSWIKGNNFGEVNYSKLVAGIKDWMKAAGTPADSNFVKQFKINPEEMNELFDTFISKRRDYTAALNKEKGSAFLDANKEKEGWQVTESGLQYKIIEAGNEVHPTEQDTVWVNYKGTLINGDIFDQNDDVRFTLNRVVKGWQEGLQLIGEGGHAELAIPSDLGYGEYGSRGIEPNSVLLFDVTLNKVGKFVEKVEEPAKKK